MVDAARSGGLYRSDDAGETWTRDEHRHRASGAAAATSPRSRRSEEPRRRLRRQHRRLQVDRRRQDASPRSRARPAATTTTRIWINPDEPATSSCSPPTRARSITVNGGETWSSWYNQPTAQFYHVITDNRFPYWVYGGQQESGSAGVASRGDDGQITFRDWHPVGVEEYGYVAPDPLEPGHHLRRQGHALRRRTGQVQNVAPERRARRQGTASSRTAPIVFSPVDPHMLYFATQRAVQDDERWAELDGDQPGPDAAQTRACRRARRLRTGRRPSRAPRRDLRHRPVATRRQHASGPGPTTALIHVTRDGGEHVDRRDAAGADGWSKVTQIDASHFDREHRLRRGINAFRLDDLTPLIYRTHDGGKTWTRITRGLAANAPVNVVREDPKTQGTAVCRDRTRCVRLVQRRRRLAAAAR